MFRSAFLTAFRDAWGRQHRRRWSWRQRRFTCRCGNALPCPVRRAWADLPTDDDDELS